MPSPAISVVMPVFNAADTLQEAVDSVRQQEFDDWELLIYDDGSADESPNIVRGFAEQDSRIRLVGSERVGIVEALRRGCRQAHAPYFARMDADDIMLPTRLGEQWTLMEEHPTVALCGAQVSMFGGTIGEGRQRYADWLNALVTHDDIEREVFIECPIAHPCFMMRRSAYEAVGGYSDAGWAEDYDLVMRFWAAGYHLANVPECLLMWRESAGRLSMQDERYSLARFRELKRHYLLRSYLAQGKQFYQWGAGEVGKRWLREWDACRPRAVVDIHPRKIGRKIHGIPVIAPEDLPARGDLIILIAVGAPGARAEIRAWLNPRGYRELQDYLFIA